MTKVAENTGNSIPPVVVRLGWVSLFTDAAGDMVYPLIVPFMQSLGAGGAALGALESVAEGVSALVKWYSGKWADRSRDRKRIVVIGYVIATLVRPVLALTNAPWQVIALRSTDRIGKGLRSAPRDAILADAVDETRRGRAFGFHQMMDNIGAIIGPLMAFGLALIWGPRAIFAFSIVPGSLSVLTLIFGVHDTGARDEPVLRATEKSKAMPLTKPVKLYLASLFAFTLGASADTFLLLYLSTLGLSTPLIPIAWLTLNASKALTNMPGGRLADRFGHKPTLIAAWSLYAAAYALFPFMHHVYSAWILVVIYGAYYGLSEGAQKAILLELAPNEQRGRALGAMHGLSGAAVVIANLVFGALFDFSIRIAFWTSASFAAVGALGLLFLVPNRKRA